MKSSSIIPHLNRSPSGWLKAMIPVFLLVLGMATQAAMAEDLDFFPLQVGNTWTYVDFNSRPSHTHTVAVVDTQRIGEHLYYLFNHDELNEVLTGLSGRDLYRKDSEGNVYVYDLELQQECLRFYVADRPMPADGVNMRMWDDLCLPRIFTNYWNGLPRARLSGNLPHSPISVEGAWGVLILQGGVIELLLVDGLGIAEVLREMSEGRYLIEAVINGQRIPRTTETLLTPAGWGTVKESTLERGDRAGRER